MKQVLAFTLEAACTIRHHAFTLRCSYLTAKVSLARFAKLALFAFRCAAASVRGSCIHDRCPDLLESHHMVANLDVCDTLADRLNDPGSLVAKDNWESALWVFPRQGVCVCLLLNPVNLLLIKLTHLYGRHQCSRPECGLRVLLAERLRWFRRSGLYRLPRRLRPDHS